MARTWLVEALQIARNARWVGPNEAVRVDPVQLEVRHMAAVDRRSRVEVHAQRVPVRPVEQFGAFEEDDTGAKWTGRIGPHGAVRRHIEGNGYIPRLDVVQPCDANRREAGREGEIPLARLTAARQVVLLGQRWRELEVLHLR